MKQKVIEILSTPPDTRVSYFVLSYWVQYLLLGVTTNWWGTWGREPGRIGSGRGKGGRKRKGGKRDSESGRNWEKRRKILQFCIMFHNRNRTKKREPLRKGAGSGSKGYRRREFHPPPPSPSSPTTKVPYTL